MTKARAPRLERREWRYAACGLAIAADAPIDGLVAVAAAARPPDVSVCLTSGAAIPPVDSAEQVWYSSPYLDPSGAPVLVAARSRSDGSYWLRYSEGATFRIDQSAACVDAWWQPPLTTVDTATYLLGPVLAFLLRLHGRVPLHASGVSVDGRAVLFAGDAGAGKSTTAAALAALGHPLLSDDVVPLSGHDDRLSAFPGYPRVSLCADAAEALFSQHGPLPRFSDTYSKRYLDLDAAALAFQRAPLPIGQLFVLAGHTTGREPIVRSIGPREALVALLRHTYGTYLIDMPMRAREFDLLARLVEAVPVHEVRFASGLDTLGAQCAALVEHCRQRA